MPDTGQPEIPSVARLRADLIGAACGVPALLLHGLLFRLPLGQVYSLTEMGGLLCTAVLGGFLTTLTKPSQLMSLKRAVGIAIHLGWRSGARAVLVGGALLILLQTFNVLGAFNAATELQLKSRLWMTWLVSIAALLPGVFCGLIGGVLGARMSGSSIASAVNTPSAPDAPMWLRRLSYGLLLLACMGLASPLLFLVRAPRVDVPPLAVVKPVPVPFQYVTPVGINTAKLGQIQPAFMKRLEGIDSDAAISLSPDGKLLAFCDRSQKEPAITVFDLHAFKPVVSLKVPAFPQNCLAWSPDMKGLACTLLSRDGERHLWILDLSAKRAVELPRPRHRDTPGGDVFWWAAKEVAFFPEDDPALVLDLESLVLKPADESPFLQKADEATRKRWTNGPRLSVPATQSWRFDLATVLSSSEPPPRLQPDAPWQLRGGAICALSHPDHPIAYGFADLPVREGMHVLCASDASKIIRVENGRAEVTYMQLNEAPNCQLEVTMPVDFDSLKDGPLKQQLAAHAVCAFVYAPLVNPLTHQTVGPDYEHLKGLVRLLKWKERKAVFFTVNPGGSIDATDVISTLHTWVAGTLAVSNDEDWRGWWAPARVLAGKSLDSLSVPPDWKPVASPSLLSLEAYGTAFQVVKALPPPKPAQPKPALVPVPAVPTPPPVPVMPVYGDAEVKVFLLAHHAKASQGDVPGMVADYDEVVDFLDKGQVSRVSIQAEELQQRQKWPKSTEAVLDPVTVARSGAAWVADYTIEFHNENTTGEWLRGRADLNMTVAAGPAGLRIIAQKAKVHDVSDSRSQAKAGPPVVPITVPRPCFVTSLRTGDHQEIEITDQISFINGVTWHRTYRELSKEGKVVNICRAIYEGSGGVSPDRQNAEIRVQSQGWERGLGGPEFVRLCEKSAVVFVGKAFRFRFTSTGMTEDHGIVFKLKK